MVDEPVPESQLSHGFLSSAVEHSPVDNPMKEEDTVEYWDRKWTLREQKWKEKVKLDGRDGEREFDREVLRRASWKEALDIGCGPGEFTLLVARPAKFIVGIDTSSVALDLARVSLAKSRRKNAKFKLGDANNLPLTDESFDLVYSRRGPASDSKRTLTQVFRVLRNGGTFLEITIGERDKQNIAEIFGRGQKLGFQGQVSAVKKRWLEEVGFRNVRAKDYLATEVFRSMYDLIIRLKTAPIIPSFDLERDRGFLDAVKAKCTSERGIETPVHRVVLTATK